MKDSGPCSSSKPVSSARGSWAGRSPRSSPRPTSPSCSRTSTRSSSTQGLEKAREVTQGQVGKLVKKEKITQEQADAQVERHARADHRHHRLRRASATSTSSSRPCRRRWRSSTRSSPTSTPPRPATRSSPPTPRGCRSPRSATPPSGPTRSWASTSSGRRRYMRLIEVIEGEETSAETAAGGRQLRPGDPQDAGPLRASARASWSTASSSRPRPRSGATRTRPGTDVEEIDRAIKEAKARADGAVLPRRHARASTRR